MADPEKQDENPASLFGGSCACGRITYESAVRAIMDLFLPFTMHCRNSGNSFLHSKFVCCSESLLMVYYLCLVVAEVFPGLPLCNLSQVSFD